MNIRGAVVLAVGFLAVTLGYSRLGETEAELFKRFGAPTGNSKHFIFAQGKMVALGPERLFRQGDWSITCDLVDGRCMRINYSKPGDWSEDQIQLVLNSNGQGAKWTEEPKSAVPGLKRVWRRTDGSTATWQKGLGMFLTWSAYDKAKTKAEEQARNEALMQKPKI
ncbi:MAG TPA: hypothetical protein VHD32_08445 [Candidatus Didemnitutus sp.]|nr:hypothetical protein [Candidatus Didemnitutus sp.]